MALTIGKVGAVHTLVVSMTGVILAVLLAVGFLRLERQQHTVGADAVALGDLARLEDSVRQWLLLSDLVFGSGETYLIAGAEAQSRLAADIVADLSASAFADECGVELNGLAALFRQNEPRLAEAALLSPETEVVVASRLLAEWDADAAAAVELLRLLRLRMTRLAEDRSAALAALRSALLSSTLVAGGLYAGLVLLMWRWVRATLVTPLRALTDAADRALQQEAPLDLEERGPEEVRSLTRSTRAFVGELEQRVRDRTRALEAREHELVAEVATRRAAEAEAASAREAAEAASRAKSEFLANMSHEIRTPLNGVLGGAELALREASGPEQRNTLQIIVQSGRQLLGVINQVLDFSKLEAGQLDLDNAEFELHDLLGEVGRLFAATAADKGVELVLAPAADLPRSLVGDGLRMRQILSNLLSNAVKFTETGEIVLHASVAGHSDSGVTVRFEVRDTGIGIPPEQQELVFDAFRQVDGSSTRRRAGTGLGLSISQRFVTLMGGDIGLVSTPGQGTTFWCTIPFGMGQPAAALVPAGGATARVSVASEALADHVTQQLRHWGYRMPSDGDVDVLVTDDEDLSRTDARRLVVLRRVGRSPALPPGSVCLTKPVLPGELHAALAAGPGAAGAPEDGDALPNFGLRVLVVEDNPVNQLVASKMLHSLGCEVTMADHGRAGLRAMKEQTHDLVLMDWHMPDMDGLEVTRRARRWEEETNRPRLPIIALTANAMDGDEAACLAAGMDGFVCKPVSLEALTEAIQQLC